MTATCSSAQAGEDRDGRYAAAVVNRVLFLLFGVFAGVAGRSSLLCLPHWSLP